MKINDTAQAWDLYTYFSARTTPADDCVGKIRWPDIIAVPTEAMAHGECTLQAAARVPGLLFLSAEPPESPLAFLSSSLFLL